MTTQYTTILKLALPVQGELSGSWGDVVNDNITEMVEEAVAGLATINSWTANSHTLTTANGTTSESRCAVLVADDDGAGNPSAAATIICPSATKLYVLKNISGQQVTLKTAAGTGVAVPNGSAAFLFCDGTNVEACQTDIIDATTIDTTNLEVTNIKAKDGTASGSIANSTGVFTINSAVLTTADINGGTIDGAVIGGSSAAAGTFTTFTSTGIDDNASSTAITIDSSQNVGIGTASPASALTVSDGTVSSLTPFGGTELFLDSIGSNYLQFGSGTSSSPAIYFGDSADGDVGGIIYAHASNAMSFRTNGSERMRIASTGNVGIGTASPNYTLEVAGTSRNTTAVAGSISHFVETTDTGASSFTQLGVSTNAGSLAMQLGTTAGGPTGFIYSAVAGGINMYTSAATNVVLGVNNNTYTYTLDAATGAWSANNAAGPSLLNEAATSTNPTLVPNKADPDTGVGWASADTLTAVTGGSERMRIDSGGKLSVGGTTGVGRLNAISSNWSENALAIYSANVASQTNFAGIAFYNQDTDSAVGNVADIYTNPAGTLSLTSGANPAIQLKYGSGGISGGTAALTVDSSGNVGIGTSSPATFTNGLAVAGSGNDGDVAVINNTVVHGHLRKSGQTTRTQWVSTIQLALV
jgi:hypothetical protein